jgi:hypothetical protein
MMQQHPITPPLELLEHWKKQHLDEGQSIDVMLIQAYRIGAEHELEACCRWLTRYGYSYIAESLKNVLANQTESDPEPKRSPL